MSTNQEEYVSGRPETVQEIVVLSGKGGTGKTSITGSFGVLAEDAVLADADVDASDLPLLFLPQDTIRHEFWCGKEARLDPNRCTGCGLCLAACRFGALAFSHGAEAGRKAWVDPSACEGCGVCTFVCPEAAMTLADRFSGHWMVSGTRGGPMIHARLEPGGANSGKLVTLVRQEARRRAVLLGKRLVLIDGPPGIGCPVIAAVTGASLVLVVTEPSFSALHDLRRVLELTRYFGIPTFVAVNRWDIHPGLTRMMEAEVLRSGATVAGRVAFDPGVTQAQVAGLTVVETETPSAEDIRRLWAVIRSKIEELNHG